MKPITERVLRRWLWTCLGIATPIAIALILTSVHHSRSRNKISEMYKTDVQAVKMINESGAQYKEPSDAAIARKTAAEVILQRSIEASKQDSGGVDVIDGRLSPSGTKIISRVSKTGEVAPAAAKLAPDTVNTAHRVAIGVGLAWVLAGLLAGLQVRVLEPQWPEAVLGEKKTWLVFVLFGLGSLFFLPFGRNSQVADSQEITAELERIADFVPSDPAPACRGILRQAGITGSAEDLVAQLINLPGVVSVRQNLYSLEVLLFGIAGPQLRLLKLRIYWSELSRHVRYKVQIVRGLERQCSEPDYWYTTSQRIPTVKKFGQDIFGLMHDLLVFQGFSLYSNKATRRRWRRALRRLSSPPPEEDAGGSA